MAINLTNPGADEAALRSALRNIIVPYHRVRLIGAGSTITFNINSTSYIQSSNFETHVPMNDFPYTHYMLSMVGLSNAAGATITGQLTTAWANPTSPVSAAGDDILITNTAGYFSSGWKQRVNGNSTGNVFPSVAFKGSNTTVDLQVIWFDIAFKIDDV
jgi:hypothetical protein